MAAQAALDHLLSVSTQVREAVVVDADGAVAGGALPVDRADALAAAGGRLLERAAVLRGGLDVQLVRVSTHGGDLYVTRRGGVTVVAATSPGSTRSLLAYDLRVAAEQAGAR